MLKHFKIKSMNGFDQDRIKKNINFNFMEVQSARCRKNIPYSANFNSL